MKGKRIDALALSRTIADVKNLIKCVTDVALVAINIKDGDRVNYCVNNYMNLRERLIGLGVPEEDVLAYDSRFKDLPWEDYGYKVPEIK